MPKKKLILTHMGNLIRKYGGQNPQPSPGDINRQEDDLDRLLAKLNQFIAFDRSRGITTEIIYLDNDNRLGNKQVRESTWYESFKNAVDEAYHQLRPDYMLILGGSDIVPFIPLRDPCIPQSMQGLFHRNVTVENIPSDLPYACEQRCRSTDQKTYQVAAFVKPTRVVSRCPDVDGNAGMGIQILLRTLDHIMQLVPRPVSDYRTPWAVCTPARTTPISRILGMMYGLAAPAPDVCAPHNDTWTTAQYHRTVHVHIVHGRRRENMLYGETQRRPIGYPLAIRSDWVDGNVTRGTVVLERACFGGQLYDPRHGQSHRSPLVNMYLACGAACMLGSTIPAFSNPQGVLMGDYMMAKFFQFLHNRTVGKAFLLTRQWLMSKDYPQKRCNEDMRMLAAFNLYGDVSAMPISDTPYPNVEEDADGAQAPIRLPGALQVNSAANGDIAQGTSEYGGIATRDASGNSGIATRDASGNDLPTESNRNENGLDRGSSKEEEENEEEIYPLEADDKLEIPKDVEKAIQSYLLKTYQIQSVDFIVCNQMMQNNEILKGRLQFTAYSQDVGTLESKDADSAGQGDDKPTAAAEQQTESDADQKNGTQKKDLDEKNNPYESEEYDMDDKQINESDTKMEQPPIVGAYFVFQTPGKTPDEPVEFLWGYTSN